MDIAREIARLFIQDVTDSEVDEHAVSAMDFTPDVWALREALAILASHAFAALAALVARPLSASLQRGPLRAKNLVNGTVRTDFAGIRSLLSSRAQDFLYRERHEIKKTLERALDAEFGGRLKNSNLKVVRRHVFDSRSVFDYVLQYRTDVTLGDWVDNMLRPEARRRRYVGQDTAMNVRTHFDRPDDHGGLLRHPLIVVEWRHLSKELLTLAEMKVRSDAADAFARRAYEVKDKLWRNGETEQGRTYIDELTDAVTALGRKPKGNDLVSRVRDLLDDTVNGAFESLREPITKREVTSNLLAETVLGLHAFYRSDDRKAGPLRQALKAIRDDVKRFNPPGSASYEDAVTVIQKADGLIEEFRGQESRHLYLSVIPGRRFWRDEVNAITNFAAYVATQVATHRGRRMDIRVESPGASTPFGSGAPHPVVTVVDLLAQELLRQGVTSEMGFIQVFEPPFDWSAKVASGVWPVSVWAQPAPRSHEAGAPGRPRPRAQTGHRPGGFASGTSGAGKYTQVFRADLTDGMLNGLTKEITRRREDISTMVVSGVDAATIGSALKNLTEAEKALAEWNPGSPHRPNSPRPSPQTTPDLETDSFWHISSHSGTDKYGDRVESPACVSVAVFTGSVGAEPAAGRPCCWADQR